MNRRRFTPAQIQKVWDRQNGICACGCGEPLVVGHYDKEHEIPLWQGMTEDEKAKLDTLDNLQLMIRRHHKVKSGKEAGQRAKEERQRRKFLGLRLNASDRELASRLSRTKQIDRGVG